VALSHARVASWVEVSAASTAITQAASIAVVASCAQVTSFSNAGTSAPPQDRSCRSTTQEEMRESGGSQMHACKIFSLFQTNPNRM
jgi:hypothetical protein